MLLKRFRVKFSRSAIRGAARNAVGLIVAPILLSGAMVAAHGAVTPVAATWCGLTSWNLEYHDLAAWYVYVYGYDENGNYKGIRLYTPNSDTRDYANCWLQNSHVDFYWYSYNLTYLGHTQKQLPPVCYSFAGLPLACYQQWSPPAQIYGP